MKSLSVMQPYCFPYLGYFQLLQAVDEFILLDDVGFIKRGFINRNFILLNEKPHRFVLPVENVSQLRRICEHEYLDTPRKTFDLFFHAYKKAPFFEPVYALLKRVLLSSERTVSELNQASIVTTLEYLGIHRKLSLSSELDPDPVEKGQDRIISLCKREGATTYINAAGGRTLYSQSGFASRGITLGFIQSRFPQYIQNGTEFVSGLSIIDVLMWNPPEHAAAMLDAWSIDLPTAESR
jgi:hypothetical protein